MAEMGVLVVGATGTQGGAVAEHLLAHERELEVVALTRDPDQPAARDLKDRGATVVEGDLLVPETFRDVLAAVDAVFAVTDYWEGGYEAEVRQGINLANVAADVGVEQFVYSSALGVGHDSGVPMFASKAEIEAHLEELGLPATVVRPSYFMQNFSLRREPIREGTLALPLAPGVRLPLLDVADVGRLVARIVDDPAAYRGRTVDLAGEELTLTEMAAAFGSALGIDVETAHIPIGVARSEFGDDYADLFAWYNQEVRTGVVADLKRQYGFYPAGFAEFLEREGWGRGRVPDAADTPQVR